MLRPCLGPARIDELLDGLEDMRVKTKGLVYTDKFSEEGFKRYAATVLAPPPLPAGSTGGSIMAIFEMLVARCGEGATYCESGLTLADIQLFNMVDVHLPLFPRHMAAFPALLALHARVAALPAIATYLASEKRPSHFWGSEWLAARGGKALEGM